MKKIFFFRIIPIIFGIAIGLLADINLLKTYVSVNTKSDSNEVIVEKKIVGQPSKIFINKLNIETEVESVGLDKENRMDIPKKDNNVSWYQPGTKPGEVGSAVIAGHLDTKVGPSVFYNLDKLEEGDVISVIDNLDNNYQFYVTKKEFFTDKDFPSDIVFGDNKDSYLNLITCYGNYDRQNLNYDKRLVVFSKLVK